MTVKMGQMTLGQLRKTIEIMGEYFEDDEIVLKAEVNQAALVRGEHKGLFEGPCAVRLELEDVERLEDLGWTVDDEWMGW